MKKLLLKMIIPLLILLGLTPLAFAKKAEQVTVVAVAMLIPALSKLD
jgi:hypothetical protein